MQRHSLRTLLLGLVLTACLPVGAANVRVSLTAIVDHPALDDTRRGVVDALRDAGYVAGKNLVLEYQSAQGSTATAAQIARKFIGSQPDVIVAMSTPSAQSVVAATRDIPVVAAPVTDPVAAKLVQSWEAAGGNVTGVSDMPLIEQHLALLRKVFPEAKRLAVVYNPGEANSIAMIAQLRTLAAQDQWTVLEAAAQSKTPLVSADPGLAARGAAIGIGSNYYDIGRQAGGLVVRILKGEAPGAIAFQVSPVLEMHVNRRAAQQQGVVLSDEVLASATNIID